MKRNFSGKGQSTTGRLAILMIPAFLLAAQLQAQDLHFSQFMNNPLLTNPANTGFNPDFDYRIGASYRSQWTSIPVPYKTMSVWGDVQLRGNIENGWIGLGGVVLRDQAGTGGLTSTKAYGSIAYHQELGVSSLLSAGFNVGFASKTVNFSKFTWENQWNGKFFDAGYTSGESFANSGITYLDLQAGLNYAYFPNEKTFINAGVSMMHLNRGKESFFADSLGGGNRIQPRYTAFVNASYKLNDQWILNPNVYYSNQARAYELVGGLMAQYNLSGDGEAQLLGGVYYRYNDAAVAMVGFEWKSLRLTFTYDATVSNLAQYNNGMGGMEFSLIKFGEYGMRTPRQSLCPSFKD